MTSPHHTARLAARECWLRAMSDPILSEKELRDLKAAILDLEHCERAHLDALQEKKPELAG